MDGQRRLPRQVRKHPLRPDVPRGLRALVRFSAVLFLFAVLGHGVLQGGHLNYPGSPWLRLPGKFASAIGLAAEDIRISGLTHHSPEVVLQAMDLKPGSSLIGFDAAQARSRLEALNWIGEAQVTRVFPNQLDVTIVEREPYAIWQHNGQHVVVDRKGAVMPGIMPEAFPGLPLIVGNGANLASEEIVEALAQVPVLKLKVFAMTRVGERRWDLTLDTGVRIQLPAIGMIDALRQAERLQAEHGLVERAVARIDLRIPSQPVIELAVAKPETQGPKISSLSKTSQDNR